MNVGRSVLRKFVDVSGLASSSSFSSSTKQSYQYLAGHSIKQQQQKSQQLAPHLASTVRHFTIAKYPPDSGDKQKAEEAIAVSKLEQAASEGDDDDNDDNAKPTFEVDKNDNKKQSAHSSFRELMGESLQPPAGCLWEPGAYDNEV